jgi:hypothetical protein
MFLVNFVLKPHVSFTDRRPNFHFKASGREPKGIFSQNIGLSAMNFDFFKFPGTRTRKSLSGNHSKSSKVEVS